jgi:hypothetical protein
MLFSDWTAARVVLYVWACVEAPQFTSAITRQFEVSAFDLCNRPSSGVARVAYTWFAVNDEGVEDGDDGQGDQRHNPIDHEHEDDADEGHNQTQPFVVPLKFQSNLDFFLRF